MKRYLIILIIFLITSTTAFVQDSIYTLSAEQVKVLVKKFHPVARQADLRIEQAKADIITAKGMFDPVASVKVANKTFDGTEYYNSVQPQLNIPTWFGIELHAGIESLSGTRTDPQETLGKTSFTGVTIPLAKNLLMDKRRAVLQQSKIFRQLSEVEKKSIINDLLLESMNAYWNWVQQYMEMQVLQDVVIINERRLELVKTAWRQGDRPAIDTTEALAQLQAFRYLLNEATLNFQNARLLLSVYLWSENDQPYEIPGIVQPDMNWQKTDITTIPSSQPDEFIKNTIATHPDLLQYNFKMEALTIEKKLKFQELLPTVNFRYNQLGKGYNVLKTTAGPLLDNNYQYGITLGLPLRLSEGRGEYRKAKLKITETQLSQNQKLLEVETKIKAYHNELTTLLKQINLQREQYYNYLTLQKGEETRFFNGESSLFLINSRENKTLETKQKLVEMETKYFKTFNTLLWSAGILADY